MAKSRRDFFSFLSLIQGEKEIAKIRLPYCDDLSLFQTYCTACETKACCHSCEEGIIHIDDQGIPYVDLKSRGCTFCDACANACPEAFLDTGLVAIQGKIELNILQCLAWNQTMCFSCKEPCLEDAISFIGLFRPSIHEQRCTRCGFCIGVCPVGAISIKGVER